MHAPETQRFPLVFKLNNLTYAPQVSVLTAFILKLTV